MENIYYRANTNQEKMAGVDILISDKVHSREKTITMLKESFYSVKGVNSSRGKT